MGREDKMQYLPLLKLVLRYGVVLFAMYLVFRIIANLINVVPEGLSGEVVAGLLGLSIGFIGASLTNAVKDLFNPEDKDGNST